MNLFTSEKNNFSINGYINKLILFLFFSSLIFIPFDDFQSLSILGGLGNRVALYPFFIIIPIIFFVLLISKKIFYINCMENNLIIGFYISCIISLIINLSSISVSLFKGQTGIKRAIIQLVSLTFLLLLMYCIQFIVSRNEISVFKLRKYICLSFIPVAILASIQLLNLLKIHDFVSIIEKCSYIVNSSLRGESYNGRIRGVCAEASYLGMYCAFLLPWLFSYIITEKKKLTKILYSMLCLLVVALVVGTKSRTAVILTMIDIVVIGTLIVFFYNNFRTKITSACILLILTIFLFSFSSIMEAIINRPGAVENKPTNTVNNYEVGQLISSISNKEIDSNIARGSMQKAALNIGLDNPLVGVGLGQFGFYSSDYIENGALKAYEVRVWTNDSIPTWPPVHSLYHRLFAETGVLGLLFYVSFAVAACMKLFIKIIKERTESTNIFGILLLASFGSILVGALTLDQLVVPQFWIMSALVILYNNNKIKVTL